MAVGDFELEPEFPYSSPAYTPEQVDRAFEKGVLFTPYSIAKPNGTIDYHVSEGSLVDRIRTGYFRLTGETSWDAWPQLIEDTALLTAEEFADRYQGWL